MTNFPQGVASFGLPILPAISGDDMKAGGGVVFWVDSGYTGGASNGTFAKPDLTLAAAITRVTASNGDVIYVKPGHAETVSADVDHTKAGLTIIGLGVGSIRPTITISGATTDITFSGNDVYLANLILFQEIF